MDHIDITYMELGLDMGTNIVNTKKCLNMMMFIFIKQHLSNIWSIKMNLDKSASY